VGEGSWSVSSQALQNTASGRTSIYGGDANWTDLVFTADVTPTDSKCDAWLIFRVTDQSNYYLFTLQGTGGKGALYKLTNGSYSSNLADGNGAVTFSANQTYQMKVELTGNTVKIYANNTLILTYSSLQTSKGTVGFGSNASSGKFDNVEVTFTGGTPFISYLLRPDISSVDLRLLPYITGQRQSGVLPCST
jgi:hypothetical protein